ncbi:MAG: thioesterase, partial [Paracoccaceae bacterium]
AGRDLYTICRIHKLGRVLVVGDAMIYSDGVNKPMARASLTYSIPPK